MTAMMCLLSTTFIFTACSDDEDETTNIVTYVAETGEDGISGNMFAITDYTSAISSVTGNNWREADNEVITACNAVFNSHRENYPDMRGTINIVKYRGTTSSPDEELKGMIIKTYIYQ